MLTQERLKELLHYDPETGVFTWLCSRQRVSAGARAGSLAKNGYRTIKIDQRHYLESRLAWLYTTGCWPEKLIDHRDRDRSNNRISNLRLATVKQNAENTTLSPRSKTGLRGVILLDRNRYPLRPFRAQIVHNNLPIHIGNFSTPEEASAAYEAMRDKLFTHHKKAA